MTDDPTSSYAPWTDDEVNTLNKFQHMPNMHPFTCGNSSRHGGGRLLATKNGWMCLDCDYTQNWAHKAMVDGTWLTALEEDLQQLYARYDKNKQPDLDKDDPQFGELWVPDAQANPDVDQ